MRDYLTNLAARNLDSTPVIKPRLASLFEPLSVVGPLFPRLGRAGDRAETIAAHYESVTDALTQPAVDQDPGTEPPLSSLPATLLTIGKEPSDPTGSEAPAPVSDQQHKPVATTMKLAEPAPRIPKETADDTGNRNQSDSESRSSEEGPRKIVIPAISVPVSAESSYRDEPGWPEKVSEATRNEVAVTLVAHTRETRRPKESAQRQNKLVERRDSESLNESRGQDRSAAIKAFSQDDRSSLQSLVVPRATMETIRAERGPRSSSSKESAAPGGAAMRTPIASIKPHQDSRARVTDTADDEPTGPEAQPSINVTIGRVEIRALLPTTSRPSKKTSESPKLMGLDDYLRQRAQGGKR